MKDKNVNIRTRLAKLERMNVRELQDKFEELFGFKTRESSHLKLRPRLAYRIQEIYLGGLSKSDIAELDKIAASDPLSNMHVPKGKGKIPRQPGIQLRRVWKNTEYVVTVLRDGLFEYDGKEYTSLSRIAGIITGNHWNGKLFFGVK